VTRAAFATTIFDVDSTISGIEGVDWLAARRSSEIAREVAAVTDSAMRGDIPLEQVYGRRLDLVRPTRGDINALGRAYVDAIAHDAGDVIQALLAAGVTVKVVSGGLRPALLFLAAYLGVAAENLHAVDVSFDAQGMYAGYEASSLLATSTGKGTLVDSLRLPRPILAVGDGSTDLAMKPAVDRFVCFTGFVRREAVVAQADASADSFRQISQMVFGA
jgi:phosphoserine phosphatase